MSDLASDSQFLAWAEDVRAHVLPKVSESALTLSVVPKGATDINFAVELGMSIMMDKPIIAIVQPGAEVPERLARVADAVVEADLDNNGPAEIQKVQQAITQALKQAGVREL